VSLSFLHPALLWGLAAAAIPLAIHLFFRRRPRPTPFPALDFVLRARKETERRLRLRRVLLFVARTALLAAAALAIARPRLMAPEARAAAGPAGPAAAAIVLDTSASMAYRLGGRTLLDRAREDALAELDALGPEEPATLLECDGSAPRAEPPVFDRAELRRRIRAAPQSWLHSDLTACVGAAAAALAEGSGGRTLRPRLVVATDLTASAWRLDAPPPEVPGPAGPVRPEVTLLDAARGQPLPNGWLSGLTAERDGAVGPRGFRVTATVHGQGAEPVRDVPLALRLGARDPRTVVRAFVELPAQGSLKKTFSHDFPAGGPVVVSAALPGDALPEDDALFLPLDVPREVRVLVVNGAPSPIRTRDEAFFVETALGGGASPVRPTVVDADGLSRVRLADHDVVFLLNVRSLGPKAAELAEFVEKGGGLFVAMGDAVDPDRYEAELKGLLPAALHVVKTADRAGGERAARLAEVDWDHPALQVFQGAGREGLESIRTFRYMLLKPERRDAGLRVVARFDDGAPALVEARRGKGRVMVFTSTLDREWSDWTIRTSFVPAMQRIAAWLGNALEARRDAVTPVGTSRALQAPPGAEVVAVVAPDGSERRPLAPESPGAGAPSVLPDAPGLWQVKVRSPDGGVALDPALAFAAWPDPRESDTRRLEPAELTAWLGGSALARVAGEGGGGGAREIPLWSWLLLLALAAFLAEGLLVA
jgi:hypothetical protein